MQEKGRASICLLRCLPRPGTLSSSAKPKATIIYYLLELQTNLRKICSRLVTEKTPTR